MELNYQENEQAIGVIKNKENHILLGSLSDFGIDGTNEDMVKQLLKSKDPRLDETFVIQSHSDFGSRDDEMMPALNTVIVTRRELFLSQLIGKPYPTYVLDTLRNPNRDTYSTTLSTAKGIQTDYEAMREDEIRSGREKAKQNDPKLDNKRKIKFGYTFSKDKGYGQDHPELAEGEIEVTERELLEAGLNPDKLFEIEIETSKKSGLRNLANSISKFFSRDSKNR